MKPAPFEYVAPTSLEAALERMAEAPGVARALAGGQSLIPAMNFRLARPEVLVDLNGVRALDFVETTEGGGLRIGAMTRQRIVERHPRVYESVPLLSEALEWVAHPQIRNRGTIGGSVAHADPAAELPPVMLALDARVEVGSARAKRTLPLADFYTGPFMTALAPDELLLAIEIPPSPPRGYAYDEFARRRGDYALAGVAALVEMGADGRCAQVRIGLVNASAVPTTAGSAEASLTGREPDPEAVADAARLAATEDAAPTGDLHASEPYRRHLIEVLTRRVVAQACARARSVASAG